MLLVNSPSTSTRISLWSNAFERNYTFGRGTDYALGRALEILRSSDGQWLSDWVTDRVIDGGLWRDQWRSLILDSPPSRKAELLHRACTEDMKHSGALAVLRAFADPNTANSLFVAYRDYQPVL
ncbi:MAG TPA: hypothetical protein VGR84_13025, partial [Candidatus Acidoferrales bacterium]|nr:hypothetical protein [Candidatus Acidoferrales bacterium]